MPEGNMREVVAWEECRGEAFYRAIGVAALDNELHSGGVDLGKRDKMLLTDRYNELVVRHLDKKFSENGLDAIKGLLVGAFAYVRFCPRRHHEDGVVMHDNSAPRREVAGLVVVKPLLDTISLDQVVDELVLPKVIYDGLNWRIVTPDDEVLDYSRVERGGKTSPFLFAERGGEYKIRRAPLPIDVPENQLE